VDEDPDAHESERDQAADIGREAKCPGDDEDAGPDRREQIDNH
jgi:hypothetical protein